MQDIADMRRAYRMLNSTGGLFARNPVLIYGWALAFVIVPTTSLKNAAVLSVCMLAATIPALVLLRLLRLLKTPEWVCMALVPIVGMIGLLAVYDRMGELFSAALHNVGIYAYLTAVNPILILKAAQEGKYKRSWLDFAADLVSSLLGFILVLFLIAGIREILGSGMIWAQKLKIKVTLTAFQTTFAGFMLTAFLIAFWRKMKKMTLKLLCAVFRQSRLIGSQVFDETV